MIDKNDPRLTSFVLGELDRQDRAEVSAAIEASPELQRAVREIEKATALLGDVFQNEPPLALREDQRAVLRQSANAHHASSSFEERRVGTAAYSTGTQGWFAEYRSSLLAFAAALMLLIAGTLYYEPGNSTVSHLENASADTDVDDIEEELDENKTESAGVEMAADKAQELTDVASLESASDEMLTSRFPKPAAKSGDLMVIRQADEKQFAGGGFGVGGGGDASDVGRGRKMMRSRSMVAGNESEVAPGNSANTVATLNELEVAKADTVGMPKVASADRSNLKTESGSENEDESAMAAAPAAAPMVMLAEAPKRTVAGRVEGDEVSVEMAASQRLIENVNQVLGQSTLNSLDFQVETKVKSYVIDMPMFETQLEKLSGLKVVDAGGGKPVTENYQQSRPVTRMVKRPTTVLFVQPIVKLDPQAAESLVEQLASSVDPEEKMTLSFEELIGIEGEVLVAASEQGDSSTVNDPAAKLSESAGGLGRGGFSKKEARVNSMERRASQAMVKYLRTQIERQTVSGKQGDERLAARNKTKVGQPRSATAVDGKGAEALEANGGEGFQGGVDKPVLVAEVKSEVKSEVKAADETEPAAVTIHWRTVRSVEELDCSELVKQLKSLLEKRNRRVRNQR